MIDVENWIEVGGVRVTGGTVVVISSVVRSLVVNVPGVAERRETE
jgi:hypothetical protein